MNAAVGAYLLQKGYRVNDMARSIIDQCDDWYRARQTEGHRRSTVNGAQYVMERMGFGQRAAADDANLCEVIEINACDGDNVQGEFVRRILTENRFDTQYRKQLEMTAAEGTSACYVTLVDGEVMDDNTVRGGQIRLNYVDALGVIPLTVRNDDMTEAAFVGEHLVEGKIHTTLVICRKNEKGIYTYEVAHFDEQGNLTAEEKAVLGEVKPFAIMRTAQVNVLDDMRGYGYPKLYGVIPVLRGLDAAFTALMGDIDTAEKLVLINELLCEFDDETGKPKTPNEQMKRRFVLLGEKLPDDKPLVHEISPEIRVEVFKDVIELLLSLLSMNFGYGTKKYSFDKGGQVTTATQYIGERQDMLQELNKQRVEAAAYIRGIVRAVLWFANTYQGTKWNIDAEVLVEFDDSCITNKAEQLEGMRADVLAGIGGGNLRKLYLMRKYNLDEKEAARWAQLEDVDADSEVED